MASIQRFTAKLHWGSKESHVRIGLSVLSEGTGPKLGLSFSFLLQAASPSGLVTQWIVLAHPIGWSKHHHRATLRSGSEDVVSLRKDEGVTMDGHWKSFSMMLVMVTISSFSVFLCHRSELELRRYNNFIVQNLLPGGSPIFCT